MSEECEECAVREEGGRVLLHSLVVAFDERDKLRRVADEVRRLLNTGYAGTLASAEVEPLISAVREYERWLAARQS